MDKKETDEVYRGVPSRVAIRHHPIHPAIVGFPVAFLSAALFTDLLFWRTSDPLWGDFSFWLLLAGWLTGLAAVLSGLVDFLLIERARSLLTGWFHFLLTDLAVFLATFNLFPRLEDRHGFVLFSGLGLSVLIFVFLVLGGFLGGQLVYHYLVGPYGSGK